ncbi:MAG: hypothetical protein O2894_05495 [Planctomycetota bacterium]|nr:hypothetical protein [Planctomycetota bacterium]
MRIRQQCQPSPRAAGSTRGFSFIEIVVVMGAMAVLMGLAVGYIGNLGKATYIAQAKAMMAETAHACLSASVGGRRATLLMRSGQDEEGFPVLTIGASIARPVITHQFESLDFASEARRPDLQGRVELERVAGHVGNCAKFGGGSLTFAPSSAFAMTEGLEFDVWIRPEAGRTLMSLVQGGEAYEILLVQSTGSDAYDVRLRMKLRKASETGRATSIDKNYETKGGPVIADGRWQRLQVSWQGLDPSIRVSGLECYEGEGIGRRPGGVLGPDEIAAVHRIDIGERGAVPLSISAAGNGYVGLMDSFRLLGVFLSEEFERQVPGDLEVIEPKLPLRVAFYDGGLDPDVHSGDQIIRIRDLTNPEDPAIRLTIGMYGTISSDYEPFSGPAVAPPARSPTDDVGKDR